MPQVMVGMERHPRASPLRFGETRMAAQAGVIAQLGRLRFQQPSETVRTAKSTWDQR